MLKSDILSSADSYRIQKTIKQPLCFRGVGLHSGVFSTLRLLPAPPNHGIVFERIGLSRPNRIFAHYDSVIATEMATTLGYVDNPKISVGTVEHVLAALFALGITNLLMKIEGPEVPILDGSAGPFIKGILEKGLMIQWFSTPVLKVLRPIKLYRSGTVCELLPRNKLRLTTSIDFSHPSIGAETFALDLTPHSFIEEISQARTFGFSQDLEVLKGKNLARGASLENVLAFSESGVLTPGGMRFPDECVRHKLLDAIGDLALCGCWIEGELVSFRAGHSVHLALLKSLKESPRNWELVPAEPIMPPEVSETQWISSFNRSVPHRADRKQPVL